MSNIKCSDERMCVGCYTGNGCDNDSLDYFEKWFNDEYPSFGGSPILKGYCNKKDEFENEFVDSKYNAYQAGQKSKQGEITQLKQQIAHLETLLYGEEK